MSEHAAFIAAIADRHHDDVPRLVYADYLEEHGMHERAEFVRIQCEIPRLEKDDPRRDDLIEREAALLQRYKSEWSIPHLRARQEFRRGFVEVIATPAVDLVALGQRLFEMSPVVHMRIINADNHVEAIAAIPGMAHLETLDLSNNSFGTRNRLVRFLSTAHLDRLARLSLRNNQIWPETVMELAASPAAAQLSSLDLSGNQISDAGALTLATSPAFTGLRRLVLRSDEITYTECLHAAAAAAIASSTTLTNLEELDLRGHYIGDAGLAALAGSRNARRLERLYVEDNEIGTIGDNGIDAVVESPHFTSLRYFRYSRNSLSRAAAKSLAGWPRLPRMRLVELTDCDFATGALEEIWASRWADRFRTGIDDPD